MNKQIKVDELPKDWLVLDHHVESSNVDFMSSEEKYKNWKDVCGCQDCNICKQEWHWDGFKTFGTKHIQLVAANPKQIFINCFWALDYELEKSDVPFKKLYYWNDENGEKAQSYTERGKDFFVYKVSDEKCL